MLRLAFLDVVLFLLPFAAYGLYLYAARAGFAPALRMGTPLLRLVAVGLGLAVIGLVLLGIFGGERGQGRYVPAQYRDGKLIPGHFE